MPDSNLTEVIKLAEQLSPENRLQLFQHLAELPDSGINSIPAAQSHRLPQKKLNDKEEKVQELKFNYNCQIQDGEVTYGLEGVEIFRVIFNAENCASVFYDKLKSNDSFLKLSPEQRTRVYAAVKEVLTEDGRSVTDEQIKHHEEEALKLLALRLLKESIELSTKHISNNLPQVVVMIWQKIVHAMIFSGANTLRDILQVPEQKFSAKEIKEALFQPDWDRLKILSGITHGGHRERKGFIWTKDKKVEFYKKVESQPKINAYSIWQYSLDTLIEQEFDVDTITWLKSRPTLKDALPELFDEAVKTWRKYLMHESWDAIKPGEKPRAFEYRHALHLLHYPDKFAYSTLDTHYYTGKKLSDFQSDA